MAHVSQIELGSRLTEWPSPAQSSVLDFPA